MTRTVKQGVYYTILKNGAKSFYIKYSLNSRQYKVKLGTDKDGWSAHRAYREREKRISNEIANVTVRSSLTFDMAFDTYIESISQKTDCYNTKSRYNTHLKNVI